MSIFDRDNGIQSITPDKLIKLGFEKITKNTYELRITACNTTFNSWWYAPINISYDIKRGMFRWKESKHVVKNFPKDHFLNKKDRRCFVKDVFDFNLAMSEMTKGTHYSYEAF